MILLFLKMLVLILHSNTINKAFRKENKMERWKEYPLIEMDISSAHPFYTGQQRLMDTTGRIEKFQKKYAQAKQASKK